MRLNASTMAEGANYGLKRSSAKVKVGLTDEGRTKKGSVRRPSGKYRYGGTGTDRPTGTCRV